jgi:hypothetical protein
MSTIAQVKELLQRILGPRADELARETHFVRRKRNLDGSDFVQGLVFGYLHQADATTEDLAQILERREVDISASGLCQRFTQSAVALGSQAGWLARAALDGQSAGRSTQCAASGRHPCWSAQHH